MLYHATIAALEGGGNNGGFSMANLQFERMTIGDRIKYLREIKEYKQVELSAKIGVSQAAINKSKLANWWADMLVEVRAFADAGAHVADFELLTGRIFEIEERRQAWLKRNGYGRGGRR